MNFLQKIVHFLQTKEKENLKKGLKPTEIVSEPAVSEKYRNSEFTCRDIFYIVFRMVRYNIPYFIRLDRHNYSCFDTPHHFKIQIDDLIIDVLCTKNGREYYNVKIEDAETNQLIALGGPDYLSYLYYNKLETLPYDSFYLSKNHLLFVDENSPPALFTHKILCNYQRKGIQALERQEQIEKKQQEKEKDEKQQERANMNQKYLDKLS